MPKVGLEYAMLSLQGRIRDLKKKLERESMSEGFRETIQEILKQHKRAIKILEEADG